jgi:arylsulfatase A-like enzyme
LDGIFIARGPQIKTAKNKSANIIDLAPTILQLLGGTLPQNLDGRVLNELFKDAYSQSISAGSKKSAVGSSPDLKEEIELSDEAEQSVRERLKSLGYI